ncbi:transposase, partial [candidate division WOR-3 bacterium]|nr:transposase [candidate division WOR-3 bacterium]
GHLPKRMHPLVDRTLMQAYQCADGKRARAILYRLVNTLKDAHPGAARSLEEGLDETLTVIDLGLPKALRQSLQTTNLIESAFPACVEGRQVGGAAGFEERQAVAERQYGRALGRAWSNGSGKAFPEDQRLSGFTGVD